MTYDAVIVGGGHNGLVTAAYLAKAGFRTLVLERRDRVGGLLMTADGVGGFRAGVVRDLELESHGFQIIEPDVVAFAPSTGVTLWRDPARTAKGLGPRDAEAFLAFDRKIRSLASFVARIQAAEPPDLTALSLSDAGTGFTLLNGLRQLGREEIRETLRALPMSVADLVSEAVDDEALRGVLGARGIRYSAMGPRSAGTALNFLWDSTAGGGAAGRTVFARGGPGALADALRSAAESHGATVRCNAEVSAIRAERGSVMGVVLADGDEIDAGIVASNADPKQTLLPLLDPAEVGPTLGWRAENIRAPGVVAKVTFTLDGVPDDERLRGRIVIAPSLDYLERAFNASKYGRVSEEPYLEATITPDGKHLNVLFQYAPHDATGEEVAGLTVQTLEAHAPDLVKRIVSRDAVTTAADLERDYGLTGGHPMHGEHALDQFFAWRPLLGHARYRLGGIHGLYLCGAGAHPGGGITGGPGRNAARAILADVRRGQSRMRALIRASE
jgi:phytoene dehydrogenase-like protein